MPLSWGQQCKTISVANGGQRGQSHLILFAYGQYARMSLYLGGCLGWDDRRVDFEKIRFWIMRNFALRRHISRVYVPALLGILASGPTVF